MITSPNFARAQKEVAFAYENVSFFRRHMEQAQLRPQDITGPESMLRLPATNKSHYRKNFPAGVLAKGRSLDERFVYRSQSSGTEGERLVTVTHNFTLAQRMFTCLAINPAFAFLIKTAKLRTCRYAAPNCSDVECSNPNSALKDRLLPDGTLVLPVYHDLLTTPPRMLEVAGKEIAEYAPDFMYVDATHLSVLARYLSTQKASPYAKPGFAIGASYSLCTAVARRQIRQFFGPEVPFAEIVAMSEFGYVAMECPKGKLHLNSKDYYLELLVDGRAANPGELAELYVTSLGDELSPHIRYKTGDLYRFSADPCACGSKHPVVRAEGRATNSLVDGARVLLTPRELDDLVGEADFIDMYAAEQVSADAFVFRFVPNELSSESRVEELQRRLAAALGPKAQLRVENVRYIPADRGGKFMTCKSVVARETLRA